MTIWISSPSGNNQVERWFAEFARKRLRRGVHTSVRHLEADIRAFIDRRNKNPKPLSHKRILRLLQVFQRAMSPIHVIDSKSGEVCVSPPHDGTSHKFHIGQLVAFRPQKTSPISAARGANEILKQLPERDGQLQYRIVNAA